MDWYGMVDKAVQDNLPKFYSLISHSEGTDRYGNNDGYDVIVGGTLFSDFSDHPRILVDLPNLGIKSTAAGRYQILSRYYDHYKIQLGLPDFSPDSQDAIAKQLIRECRALEDIREGRIATAIYKCKSRWASFPGANYGQYEHDMNDLLAYFEKIGGYIK